ncbi:AraC-type DNA-binding protein [Pseudarcicella hirudinis]|uniref:AraC-type DNA-binding protein n=1 Tax=Pseudarcicella hirudinis TaxID=1079859 RepID=A0A1I5Z1X0_9BACT|nr:helix-turn-helix domain-containing protein [Pseudarcicella hirudinis]SFQ50429.1 AraC-type DNA-binding protein [Pseudarcicella hirudinis]
MEILSIINFTAAIQGIFLAFLLFSHQTDAKENRILSLLVLVMSFALLGAVLGLSGYYKVFPHLIRVADPMVLLFGPLLYFYVHFITKGSLPEKSIFHFIPFFLYTICLIPFYTLGGQEKIAFGEQILLNKKQNQFVLTVQTIRIVHISIYVFLSLKLVRRFQNWLKNNFSDIDKISLDKAAFLLNLYLTLMIFIFIIYGLSFFIPLDFVLTNNVMGLSLSAVIYALAYTSWGKRVVVNMPEQIAENPVITDPEPLLSNEKGRRNTYHVSEEQAAILVEKLEKLLFSDKIFIQSDLSLSQLSEQLNTPAYQVSEIINRHYQESFFDLINRCRIEEIKLRLNDERFNRFSILGIAMDCGFNSKSSFNTAFRKFTGTTPSDFRNK